MWFLIRQGRLRKGSPAQGYIGRVERLARATGRPGAAGRPGKAKGRPVVGRPCRWHHIDKSAALAEYGRRAKDQKLIAYATEVRKRAERRVGEMMQEQKERFGLNKGGRPNKPHPGPDAVKIPTLAEVGIDVHLADKARKLAAMPEATLVVIAPQCGAVVVCLGAGIGRLVPPAFPH